MAMPDKPSLCEKLNQVPVAKQGVLDDCPLEIFDPDNGRKVPNPLVKIIDQSGEVYGGAIKHITFYYTSTSTLYITYSGSYQQMISLGNADDAKNVARQLDKILENPPNCSVTIYPKNKLYETGEEEEQRLVNL
jgi:hypothetical protein